MKTKPVLPTKPALLDAMALAKNSSDAANYLATRFDDILIKAKVGSEADGLRQVIHDFAQQVAYQLQSNQRSWEGRATEDSLFKNMHARMADEAASFFEQMQPNKEQKAEIRFDFAINDNAEFIRGVETISKPDNTLQEEHQNNVSAGPVGG